MPIPPGFPFFLMVTHVFTWLPFGSIAVRTNVASAFFAALACALVALSAAEILLMPRDVRVARVSGRRKRSKKKQKNVGRTLHRCENRSDGKSDLTTIRPTFVDGWSR